SPCESQPIRITAGQCLSAFQTPPEAPIIQGILCLEIEREPSGSLSYRLEWISEIQHGVHAITTRAARQLLSRVAIIVIRHFPATSDNGPLSFSNCSGCLKAIGPVVRRR